MRALVIGSLAVGAVLCLWLLLDVYKLAYGPALPSAYRPVVTVLGPALVLVPLYFLPSLIAHGKQHAGTIFAVNLFLGWTLLGWVGALVWAATDQPSMNP